VTLRLGACRHGCLRYGAGKMPAVHWGDGRRRFSAREAVAVCGRRAEAERACGGMQLVSVPRPTSRGRRRVDASVGVCRHGCLRYGPGKMPAVRPGEGD